MFPGRTTSVCSLLAALAACGGDAQVANERTGTPAAAAPAPASSPEARADDELAAVRTTVGGMRTALAGITDAASAERARTELTRLAADLRQRVGERGDLPRWVRELDGEAGDLRGALQARVGQMAAQPAIAKALGPLLDELRQLAFGGGPWGAAPFVYTIF